MLPWLAAIISVVDPGQKFAILEMGALRTKEQLQTFYSLLDLYPASRLNQAPPPGRDGARKTYAEQIT